MKSFTATLPQEQWDVIGAALGNMPYVQAAPIVNALNAQFQRQIADEQERPHSGEGDETDARET